MPAYFRRPFSFKIILMKFALTLIASFLVGLAVQSQTASDLIPCGNTSADFDLKEIQRARQYMDQYRASEETYYIPLQFHTLADDNGNGRYYRQEVLQMLCDANEDFAPYNMQFYLFNDFINEVDNTDWYDHDEFSGGYEMMFANNVAGAVNVYVVADPAGACGYFSPFADGVAVAKTCAEPGSTTLSHELGHFFSLPHTFNGWEGGNTPAPSQQERVDGLNCGFVADGFCDTPPDYVSSRWNCPYTLLTDPEGVEFRPDGTFFMSYSNDGCQNRFSDEQVAAMKYNIDFNRAELLDDDESLALNDDPVNASDLAYPAHFGTVGTSTTLHWTESPNATAYSLFIQSYDIDFRLDTIVYTNQMELENLVDGASYFWKVKAYHHGNYCAPATLQRRFYVEGQTLVDVSEVVINPPSCYGSDDGSITIVLDTEWENYTITWPDGSTGFTLEGLTDDNNVEAIVTNDDTGESVELNFNIQEPFEIQAFVDVRVNNVSLSVDGGTAPFDFEWSSGTSEASFTEDLEPGPNSAVVIDSNGCTDTVEFIYAVPDLTVNNVTCQGAQDGAIFVQGLLGGEAPFTYEWGDGTAEFFLVNLAAGDYELTITDANGLVVTNSYTIEEADSPLQLGFVYTASGAVQLIPVGGAPPYEFLWLHDGSSELVRDDLSAGTYAVRLIDSFGCETTTNIAFSPVSTADLSASTLRFFQRDQQAILELGDGDWRDGRVQLFDISGRQLLAQQLAAGQNRWMADLSAFTAGMYILRVQTPTGSVETIKFVK